MWRRPVWLCALSALAIVALRCGGDDSNPGETGGTTGASGSTTTSTGGTTTGGTGGTTSPPICGGAASACSTNDQCCSKLCEANLCKSDIGNCLGGGLACGSNTACCSLRCESGTCSGTKCINDNEACTSNESCCGGNCSSGKCAPLNTGCKTAGNSCGANIECCSKLCANGACAITPAWCIQNGDACSNANDCCGGICTIATGKTIGTCSSPAVGATNCSDGVDGTVCDACNGCCSRLCAPYGPTGVKVCQPASGCHVNGDLCRKDQDCCGGAGSGLPGDGNVKCEIVPGTAIGLCRNPMSCNPEGNVCHYKDYACDISSSRNDCCAAVGNSGVCQLDALGVPRCYGLGADCRMPGETCASQADCCNSVPCIPDSTGKLICATPPEAGPVCRNPGESCTIDGDCCPGFLCVKLPGATTGTCGTPPSTPDAGSCALYGQACTTGADCCSGITCLGPNNTACGGTGCTCYNLIP